MLKSGQLNFDWASIRVAIEGHSFVDVPRLSLSSKVEAKQFLLSYGYDIDDPIVREELWRIYFESLAFLKNALLNSGERIPAEFLQRSAQNDTIKLLLDAALASESPRGKWACAILRVMHIISHLDNDIRLENFQYAREQVFARFESFVSLSGRRRWQFGRGADAVPLVRFIKKQRKERDSILTKLLSRPTNIVEEIYDSLGFRFVTETRFDCYRLLQQLIKTGAVSPANIQPGRSVNAMISFETLKEVIAQTREELQKGKITNKTVHKRLAKLEEEEAVSWNELRNPLTSRWYRALQFTCRQLIVAPDPTFKFWSEVRSQLEKNKVLNSALKKIPITLRERRTFYYPFEIQIMDKESYVESIGGRSRHREYKAKQRLLARNRVLRDLI